MRHGVAGRKFGRTTNQRKALISNLAEAIINAEQIVTTLPKAKDLRPVIEKLVTCARKGTLASRRKIASFVKDPKAQKKIVDVLGPRYTSRPGGYTRILKAGYRYGDSAPLAVIEFVDRAQAQPKNVKPKKSAEKDVSVEKETQKKPAKKKEIVEKTEKKKSDEKKSKIVKKEEKK